MGTSKDNRVTPRQAIVNICNNSVGIGILAKPFAFAMSGWSAIGAMILASITIIYVAVLLGQSTLITVQPIMSPHQSITKYHSINTQTVNSQTIKKRKRSGFALVCYSVSN